MIHLKVCGTSLPILLIYSFRMAIIEKGSYAVVVPSHTQRRVEVLRENTIKMVQHFVINGHKFGVILKRNIF